MIHPNDEKETSCVFDYITNEWEVYSCVPRHMTKLNKLAVPFWTEKEGERVTAAKWKLKGNQVRFSLSIVSKMTDEQKEASKARLQTYRENRESMV
jgi:hypothetical protein